jgi:predicted nuclease with TOPRIM domain
MTNNEITQIKKGEKSKQEEQEELKKPENPEAEGSDIENKIEDQVNDLEKNTQELEEELEDVSEEDFEEDKEVGDSIKDKLNRISLGTQILVGFSVVSLAQEIYTGGSLTKGLVATGITVVFAAISYFRNTRKEELRRAKQ